jgi:type II secretory pathway component PulC
MRANEGRGGTPTDTATRLGVVVVASALGLFSLGASQPSAPPLPDSALPVTLLGVAMNATAPAKSACLVHCTYLDQTQTTSLLATGERACDVAEIAEIFQRSVVIKNLLTNRLELLTFPRTGAAPSKTASAMAEPPEAAPRALEESPNVVTLDVPKASMNHYLANLPELLGSALATPHYRDAGNGQSIIEGFEINRIKEASAAEQLGLQNGDVVLEVNGDKLDSAASILRLLGQAQTLTHAKLIVLRNGQRMTFVVNMK